MPKTTLKDRLSGGVQHGSKPGPKPYFDEEVSKLFDFLKKCSSIGYGKTRRDVMNIAEKYVSGKGILTKERISDGWWH